MIKSQKSLYAKGKSLEGYNIEFCQISEIQMRDINLMHMWLHPMPKFHFL